MTEPFTLHVLRDEVPQLSQLPNLRLPRHVAYPLAQATLRDVDRWLESWQFDRRGGLTGEAGIGGQDGIRAVVTDPTGQAVAWYLQSSYRGRNTRYTWLKVEPTVRFTQLGHTDHLWPSKPDDLDSIVAQYGEAKADPILTWDHGIARYRISLPAWMPDAKLNQLLNVFYGARQDEERAAGRRYATRKKRLKVRAHFTGKGLQRVTGAMILPEVTIDLDKAGPSIKDRMARHKAEDELAGQAALESGACYVDHWGHPRRRPEAA